MDIDRYRGSPVGVLEPIAVNDPRDDTTYEHAAFIPHPAPRDLDLSSSTIAVLLDAQLALGRLDGAASELLDPVLFVRPTIRREAVSTSALEGTFTALDEILRDEAVGDEGDREVREVLNYVRAAEHGIRRLGERPVSVNLVNELHDLLMRGTRGDSATRGRIREHQNWIGPEQCRVVDAHFVPPPPGERLLSGLADWERYVHDEDVPLLVRCAVGHYLFETLHPYTDGNGRLGRLLIVLQLIEGGALGDHLITVSPLLERQRDTYVDHLQAIRETGDFEPFIRFLADNIAGAARNSLERIRTLFAGRDEMVGRVRGSGSRGLAVQIAHDLVGFPYVTAPGVAARYERTYQAASNAIAKLVELGILDEVAGTSQPRAYAATDVVRLLAAR